MRSKGVALVLAALMVWALAAPSVAQVNPFTDLRRDHWAYEAILLLAAAGLIEGYPDGTFGGDRTFTRYEMAMVFARMLARFERLIDEKVASGIEVKTSNLAEAISETRRELAAMILANREELAALIEANREELAALIGSLQERVAALETEEAVPVSTAPLSPEAQAALAQLAIDDLANRVRELASKGDVEALAERIANAESRIDGVSARVDGLEARVGGVEAEIAAFDARVSGVEGGLADVSARVDGVVARLEGVDARIAEVDGRIQEVSARVDGLDGSVRRLADALAALEDRKALTEEDARAIAELVIADALAEREREVTAALEAVQGNNDELSRLIQTKVAEVVDRIERLANEFRPELERLGVQVAALEERMYRQEQIIAVLSEQVAANTRDIEALQAETRRIRFDGRVETELVQTALEGTGPFWKDARDQSDKDAIWKAQNGFEGSLTLGVTAQPAENVDIRAELTFRDIFGGADVLHPAVNLTVTTPGVLRALHVGELQRDQIARYFDKYTLVEDKLKKKFDDEDDKTVDFQGASFDVVFGYQDSTSVHGFVSRQSDADFVFGGAAAYTLSDEFAFIFRGVKDVVTPAASTATPTPHSDAAVGVTVSGTIEPVDYELTYVRNADEDPADAIEGWARVPLLIATAELRYASVGKDFNPAFGKDLNSHPNNVRGYDPKTSHSSNDWLDRKLNPVDDWVEAGESDLAATISVPLFGLDTALTFGRRTDDTGEPDAAMDNNVYTQLEVGPVFVEGLGINVLYDRRTNDADEVDNTLRATFRTSALGGDVELTLHNRRNEQAAALYPAEVDQRSVWLAFTKNAEFVVPVTLEARLASNLALGESSGKLGVSAEHRFGGLLLKAGVSTETNALGAADENVSTTWWKNATWNASDAQRDTLVVGAEYTIRGLFGTDVDTGYEYRLVREDGVVLGAARNTFRASFEKQLRGGEAILAGKGKLVTGGIPSEEGNETDLTAELSLTYPVFEGAQLKLRGAVTSSVGAKANEFNAYHLGAGLLVEF